MSLRFETIIIDPDPEVLSLEFRGVLDYWNSKKNDRLAPAWENFHLDELATSILTHCAVLDVYNDPLDFVYRYWGTAKTPQMGYDLTGKSVMGVKPRSSADKLFGEFVSVLERKTPTLFRTNVRTASGTESYTYFRLPFSSDNQSVDHIFSVGDHARGIEFAWREEK